MFTNLPLELIRKILSMLPITQFIDTLKTCHLIKNLELNKLLLGWYLVSIPQFENTFELDIIRIYNKIARNKGPLYCMYDLLDVISWRTGDHTVWDTIEVTHHDYITKLINAGLNKPNIYLQKNNESRRIIEKYGHFRGRAILKRPLVYNLIL